MKKAYNNTIIILAIFIAVVAGTVAQTYPYPDYLSPKDVAEWVMRGGQIASGTAEPTGVASEGNLYVRTATPTAPVLYRSDGTDWQTIAGGGTDGGVATHSELTNLDYDSSGHTGFNSAASFTAHEAETSTHGVSGAIVGTSDAQTISNKIIDSSNTIDGSAISSISGNIITNGTVDESFIDADIARDAELDAHIDTKVNPHGATQTIEMALKMGSDSATATASIDNPVDGGIRIASFVILAPLSVTPGLATGGIYFDDDGYFYGCDGATWTQF